MVFRALGLNTAFLQPRMPALALLCPVARSIEEIALNRALIGLGDIFRHQPTRAKNAQRNDASNGKHSNKRFQHIHSSTVKRALWG